MAATKKLPEGDEIDWTKQDVAIAEQYGVTRECVRQHRRKLGKPDSCNKRRKRKAVSCGGIVV